LKHAKNTVKRVLRSLRVTSLVLGSCVIEKMMAMNGKESH